ncbi:ISAs1 family transposase [Hymenobacter siberiensis]|uniref:ISAs1 family transposase n=1 Tax=Hymenobacter siberiensis TaxID=2848396 RepID=UPI001C1E074A
MDYAEFFEEVTDYRVQGRCLHELSDILLLVLRGLLADCEIFEDIYDYACDKEATLREFMDLPAGIPSHDTLNRVFRHLVPTELERCLSQWGQAIVTLLAGRHLIIDGKQLRGTTPAGKRQAPVQLVSVWAAEQRLCLAQTAVETKRNELVAIPQVLDLVEVKGSVVTLDAMGCQRAVAAELVAKGADYVLAAQAESGRVTPAGSCPLCPLARPARRPPAARQGTWARGAAPGLGQPTLGAGGCRRRLAGLANAGLPADHALGGRAGATGHALFSLLAGRSECGHASGVHSWILEY